MCSRELLGPGNTTLHHLSLAYTGLPADSAAKAAQLCKGSLTHLDLSGNGLA